MLPRYFTAFTTSVALSVLAAATPATAADFKSSEDFAAKATVAGLFEIKSSQLALERSQDPQVRAFAEQMISDHTKADSDLKKAMTSSKIDTKILPTKLDDKHQRVYDELTNLPADKFDEEYMEAQDDAHEEAIALFKSYAGSGDSTALKQFANDTLPTLRTHADHVEKIDDDVDD